jgi:hypothetical protein
LANCDDDSENTLLELSQEYNIVVDWAERIGRYIDTDNPNRYGVSDLALRIKDSYKRGLEYVRQKYKNQEHWSIFIEVDEYLVPQKDLNLSDIVKLVPKRIHRICIASYDFKCPFDLNLPVFNQTYYRWSENTKRDGIVKGITGYFKGRGKSMVKTNMCIADKIDIHSIDGSDCCQYNDLLLINHYRNYGELQTYDYYDDKIKRWIR